VDVDVAYLLLLSGDFAGAYLLLKGLLNEPPDSASFAARYNLALCLLMATEHAKATAVLEAALSRLPRPMPSEHHDDIYGRLALSWQQHYLAPLPARAPDLLPNRCKQNAYRILIDSYAAQGLFDKVRSLANGLTQFDNVAAATARAQEHGQCS
jgi:tetratricopeptide (TPR) repeat protein